MGYWALWLQTAGMVGMTLAFSTAGSAQTYLERGMGPGSLDTQPKSQVHFTMLAATGALFTAGVSRFPLARFPGAPLRRPPIPAPVDAEPLPAAGAWNGDDDAGRDAWGESRGEPREPRQRRRRDRRAGAGAPRAPPHRARAVLRPGGRRGDA